MKKLLLGCLVFMSVLSCETDDVSRSVEEENFGYDKCNCGDIIELDFGDNPQLGDPATVILVELYGTGEEATFTDRELITDIPYMGEEEKEKRIGTPICREPERRFNGGINYNYVVDCDL